MRFKSRTRAMAVAALAASVSLAGLTTVAPAGAAPASTDRIAGDDRYETAAEVATTAYTGTVDTVVVTTGEKLPDALSANPIAGAEDAPILLVQRNAVPASAQAALAQLQPDNIIIVGGTEAVSAAVETGLEGAGFNVTREAGDDRFATAAEVARAVGAGPDIDADGTGSQTALSTVAIANGLTGLPDAVAASPMLHKFAVPLLLTGPDTLNEDAMQAIEDVGAEQALLLGGTTAISLAIEQSLEADGINAERLAGNDRWGTAAAIADFEINRLGFDAATTYIASGFSLADALAGGPLASVTNSPIVLVSETSVPAPTAAWIEKRAAEIDEIIALGGTDVINDTVLDEAAELADEDADGNATFSITPAEAAENTVSAAGTNTGARQYTISGLTNTTTYDIALFAAQNVRSADGVVSFVDTTPNDNVADLTVDTTGAVIEVVNGQAVATPDNHVEVNPVNGSITFTVDSESGDAVVPVIFVETTDADNLNLDANDRPTEPFGVGGAKSFVPAEGATDDLGTSDEAILSVDKTADRIVTDEFTYFYDANDTFFVIAGQAGDIPTAAGPPATGEGDDDCAAATQVTLAQFEAELSAGDELDESTFYQANAELPSRFCLEDTSPTAPTVSAVTPRDTSAVFTVTGVTAGATVNVYCGPNDDNAFNRATDTLRGQSATDQVADVAGFQVVATGLTVSAAYDCFVTQTVAGEESAPAVRNDVMTTPAADPALITDARLTTDAPIVDRVGNNDVWTLVFDEALNPATLADATIDLTDPDGDVIRVRCNGTTADAAGDFLTDATCALGAGADATVNNDTLTITLNENAEDRNAGGDAGTAGGGIEYPLTINDIAGLVDLQNEDPNVAGSPDRVIDTEAP